MLETLRMNRKLPPSLKGTFWQLLIEAVEEEILDYRNTVVDKKKYLYDIPNMDRNRLIEISNLLGVVFDASIASDEEFLRKEVEAIPFKILYKGTALLYKSFFLSLNRIGEMFIYYFQASSNALVRSSVSPLLDIYAHDPTKPFAHRSSNNFTGYVEDQFRLDTGLVLDVESGGSLWTLDTADSSISSNHIALEYVIDRIITKQVRIDNVLVNKEFLMTQEYLSYVTENANYGRRVKEVPHVGSQLTAVTDISGVFDHANPGAAYSIPDIKLKVACRPDLEANIVSVYDLTYMEFGIGSRPLPSSNNSEVFPTDLANRVARSYLIFDERWEDENWLACVGEYLGQQINRLVAVPPGVPGVSPDGSLNSFSFTLPFAPIQRGNVRITLQSGGLERVITDNRKGALISDFGSGTINYTTGECSLSTDFDHTVEERIAVAPAYDDALEPNKVNYSWNFTADTDVYPESIWLNFTTGEGGAQRRHVAVDNGAGEFVHPMILSSSIDYVTRTMDIEFAVPLTPESELREKHTYRRTAPPDNGTLVFADYYFTQRTIEITEAGVFNNAGEMLMYATFPPLEFSSVQNHVNVMFAVKKTV